MSSKRKRDYLIQVKDYAGFSNAKSWITQHKFRSLAKATVIYYQLLNETNNPVRLFWKGKRVILERTDNG